MNLLEALDAPTASPAPPAGSPPGTPAPAVAPTGPPPTITSNRRRLDNRFPVLAFAVRTQGRPWFEVLLTTDRSLFDPAHAARRTPTNFYAGRQDGGLSRATADDTAYVVPAGVLRRFSSATPRPAEIFFTVAAYERPDGPPVLALPVAVLASTAPSVSLSRDFQAQTMAVVLGVPAEKLQPMDTAAPPAAGIASPRDHQGADDVVGVAQSWSSEEDDAIAMEQASAAWFEDPHALALDDATAFDTPVSEPESGYDPVAYEGAFADQAGDDDAMHGLVGEQASNGEVVAHGYEDDAVDEHAEAFDYDDGYDTAASVDDGWSQAAESSWPAGAAEPEQLADADDQRLDDELAMAAADELEPYDGGQGLDAGYDDAPPYDEAQAFDDDAGYDDALAYDDDDEAGAVATALEVPLDIPGKIAIVTKIGRLFESSAAYTGINADTEFSNPRLSQYQRWHVGLSFGLIQFTQDSGGLGQLLRMMRERDPARFREIFGPDADALVEVTNRSGPSGREVPGGRSVRVQPVGGADLWQEPWISRFRAAGAHPPFQAAQNELAVRRHVDPMLAFAAGFGLNTERALAMVVDRGIQMGTGGARRWLTEAIGPIRTDAQRQQALGALGQPDLASFQRTAGVRRDGDFGPLTHAAMVGALRRLGPASPVPIPTRDQMLDAIVARADAAGVFWRRRPQTIRTSREFADVQLTWPAATTSP